MSMSGSPGLSINASGGLFAKRLVVMLDIDGEKKILRDVLARDVADLIEVVALHAQLRAEYLASNTQAAADGNDARGLSVQYFNDELHAFTELTDAAWSLLAGKRHVELRLRRPADAAVVHQAAPRIGDPTSIESVRGSGTTSMGNPGSTDRDAAVARPGVYITPPAALLSIASRRARVVDFVRNVLVQGIPNLSRDVLIRVCSAVVQQYQASSGYSDADMAAESVDDAVNIDLVMSLVQQEARKPPLSQRQLPAVVHQQPPAVPSPLSSSSVASVTLSPDQAIRPSVPLHGAVAKESSNVFVSTTRQTNREVMAHRTNAAPVIPADAHSGREQNHWQGTSTAASRDSVLASFVTTKGEASPQQPPPVQRTHNTALDDGEALRFYDDYDRRTAARGRQPRGDTTAANSGHMPAAPARGGDQPAFGAQKAAPLSLAAAQHSTFRTVRYVVSGAFPPPANNDASEEVIGGAANVRVALTVPHVILPDDDILVTAHVVVRSSVSLSWWLCYGPQCITLNLDEMYNRNCVKTFQVSETGLLLTIRRGTLVPGWDYRICLAATSDITGASASDQAQFRVSKFGDGVVVQEEEGTAGGRRASPSTSQQSSRNGRTVSNNDYLPPTMRGTTSTQQRHLGGYQGDADEGGGLVGALVSRPDPSLNAATTQRASPHAGRYSPNAAAAAALNRSDDVVVAATPSPQQPNNNSIDAPNNHQRSAIGMTFQEQLKHFFLDEVQPLYRLCLRPNMRQDTFSSILKNVAQAYWFARPADAHLDAALQRDIIDRVKHEILEHRSNSSGYSLADKGSVPFGTSTNVWSGASSSQAGDGGALGIHIPPVGLRPQYAAQVRR